MFIIVHCMGMPFNGSTIEEESLGGSETAAYYVAKELAVLGHKVTLFTTHPTEGEWDGVRYLYTGEPTGAAPLGTHFHFYAASTPSDVLIIQRHPQAFAQQWASKVNLWWLHDLGLYRQKDLVSHQMWNIDGVLTVSEYHKAQVCEVYDIDPSFVTVIRNAIDLSLFAGDTVTDFGKPSKYRLLYSSRPERGLENLVKEGGVLDHLPKNYELAVCAYANTTPQMVGYYEHLASLCASRPNVKDYGALTKQELADLMRQSDLLVYPTTFEEVSCITAMESMGAGLPMLSSNHAALPETCKGSGTKLLDLVKGEVNCKLFAEKVRSICEAKQRGTMMRKQQRVSAHKRAWSGVAERLMSRIESTFALSTEASVRRRMYINSDYYALQCTKPVPADPLDVALGKRVATCYEFAAADDFENHYKEYYDYEKERGAIYGPETLDGNSRYQYVASRVALVADGCTILDYGCAHGHYTINLAIRFPDKHFVGYDITQSNIDTARKWAEDEGITNVEFHRAFISGDDPALHGHVLETGPSLIIAAEVLEHVANPQKIVYALMAIAGLDCEMVITTPYGPWEADGYNEHSPWRAHLWHFERADLHDLWGQFPEFNVVVVPSGYSQRHELVGSYVCTFKASSTMLMGAVNMPRKIAQTTGAESMSLCMIVKDEETNIGRCIESVIGVVDEVVVCIDDRTTDGTEDVLRALQAKYPEVVFYWTCIEPATKTGFDIARNKSLAEAHGDWILWMDADEVMSSTLFLRKYLRNSQYAGFAIAQHHFSIEPPSLLQTDLPIRVFRNRIGVQFFGRVHEHPEKVMNEGVGKALVLTDVSIGHYGYASEAIRRKRFDRNFELMQEDRKVNPDRILGKHLWIRDVAQAIGYEREIGNPVTGEMMRLAKEAIVLWRELLDLNARMAADALPYYSSLVLLAGTNESVDYEFTVKAGPGTGKLNGGPGTSYAGTFFNKEHAKALFNKVESTKLEHLDSRYL